MVTVENTTPSRLVLKLAVYFLILIAVIILVITLHSEALHYLPVGGHDALQDSALEITQSKLSIARGKSSGSATVIDHAPVTSTSVRHAILFLAANLGGTILVMLPITWTYSATKFDVGPAKNFVRALLVLPICASTVVLLIQDSLALAFGLAALVAAVRFRVSLSDTIDGIYIFAAICVGLAAGIGYLGIGTIMALFFCMTNAILWQLDYGKNPIDDSRQKAKKAKLDKLSQ